MRPELSASGIMLRRPHLASRSVGITEPADRPARCTTLRGVRGAGLAATLSRGAALAVAIGVGALLACRWRRPRLPLAALVAGLALLAAGRPAARAPARPAGRRG
jgi:hypothetical protein